MSHHSAGFLKIVNEAKQEIKETDIETLKQKLDAKEAFHLIDVREEHEWKQGRLPTAVHLCKGIIERDIEKNIADHDAEIILYCGGGYRSALAALNLQRMGYTHVISMDGGFRGWKEAGFIIEVE